MISNVYRIERYQDIVSMIPPIKKIEEWNSVKTIKGVMDFISSIKDLIGTIKDLVEFISLLSLNVAAFPLALAKKVFSKLKDDIEGWLKDKIFDLFNEYIIKKLTAMYPSGYCHIGGLYVINEENNKFYHCVNFYNKESKSPYCKNWGIQFGKLHDIPKYLKNHNYLTNQQRPMERCQDNKKMRFFI